MLRTSRTETAAQAALTLHLGQSAAGRLLGALLMAVFALSLSLETWAQVGFVHGVVGAATVQRGSAKPERLKAGEKFAPGARFATGDASGLMLKFADGQLVVVGPNSVARVERYQYSPKNLKASSMTIGLIEGVMRFVGGEIAAQNREAVRVVAGESTIRVLKAGGADFTVAVRRPDEGEHGVASVAKGEISVDTPYGLIVRIDEEHAAPWRPGQALRDPIPLAAAPAAIQAELAGMAAVALPGNGPVAIDTAALAAARAEGDAPKVSGVSLGSVDTSGQAGYAVGLSGAVLVQRGTGPAVPMQPGDTFNPGTTVDTGATGNVVLKFADGQVLVLGPNSVVRVEQYRFDETNVRNSSSSIALLNGSMRYVGGEIAAENPGRVRVSAGASIVQIAGAGPVDYTLVVDTRGQEMGVASVQAGVISVRTPYGQISKVEANEAAPWLAGKVPAKPVPASQTPSAVQGQLATLAAAALPPAGPVAVGTAAQAVVAVTAAEQARAASQANPADTQLQTAAQAAAAAAAAAVRATASAVEDLIAKIIETKLSALPATAAGPAPSTLALLSGGEIQVAPGAADLAQTLAALPATAAGPAPADLQVTPIAPITTVTTPSGGGQCVGSPC